MGKVARQNVYDVRREISWLRLQDENYVFDVRIQNSMDKMAT